MAKNNHGLKQNSLEMLLGDMEVQQTLLEPESAKNNSTNLIKLSLAKISTAKWQPRQVFDNDKLQELAESIKQQGVLQPILVRPLADQTYQIVAGERRFRAAQLAGLSSIPVIIKPLTEADALALAIIENIQRADLNPLEEAQAFNRLQQQYSLTQAQIAAKVGKQRSTVANLLRLLELEPSVQQLLANGQLTMGHARALLTLSAAQQIKISQQVINLGLSVRSTETLVGNIQSTAAQHKKLISAATIDPNIKHLQTQLTEHLGTAVKLQHNNTGRGTLVIKYHNIDELSGILTKMNIDTESYED